MNTPNREARFPAEPLAIVGMACRLPGADNLDAFWNLMETGGSGIREMPDDRLDRRLYFSKEIGQLSKTYSSISGLIPQRPDDPSSDFRSMDLNDLQWDPCHEILCGVVDQARLNAGWSIEQLSGPRAGVYIGHCSGSALGGELVLGSMIPEVADNLAQVLDSQGLSESERHEILARLVARIQSQRPVMTENKPKLEAHSAAQLIAQRFHLNGPQMSIDAACASSLTALALATLALTQGEIDHAVVSSASYSKADSLILFSQAQSCSATESRPFDAEANGLVNAEGYITVLIKTLRRAHLDGDKIQGIIRGIGVSCDGRGRSLWAPRKEGQLEAVRRAYTDEVTKDSVQYLEAHATSTQVGDATELEALAAFFHDPLNKRKIPLGSVKSNIGHTLESAGLASLVKCILCMQKGFVPPTINLTQLNPTVEWESHPFSPVRALIAWPDVEHQPRRAAINSFGIGGLNAHVILDGPADQNLPTSEGSLHPFTTIRQTHASQNGIHRSKNDGAVAIIGRGLVLPGASDVNTFRNQLQSEKSQLVSPPVDRWRDTPFSGSRPAIHRAFEHAKGGYIRDYKYDWRKHKIPPLQIEHANPLQFMLLDATQQALDESGYGIRPFDKSRAAVVVGTLFGGEFSHHLLVGLRIPEILDELATTLRERQWDERRIQKLCKAAQDQILKFYPAIKDQTGSFTCSTQASRVAKTLNIMGGAMAIDSGDCSSLAALQSAQHLLGSGVTDFVFCAAAQRHLDAPAFEAWSHRTFELDPSIIQSTGDATLYPGEGVVVLMLRRLEDAIASNDTIHGVIRDVRANSYHGPMGAPPGDKSPAKLARTAPSTEIRSPVSSPLTRQFGHLQSASGLLEILALTTRNEVDAAESVIVTNTESCEYHAVFETSGSVRGPKTNSSEHSLLESVPELAMAESLNKMQFANKNSVAHPEKTKGTASEALVRTNSQRATTEAQDAKIIRVWGVDEFELRQRLAALKDFSKSVAVEVEASSFPRRAPYRLAIVTTNEDFQNKQQTTLELLERGASPIRLQEQGIYYSGPQAAANPMLAAMFPGQGSQRSGMISDVIKTSNSATRMLQRADRCLINLGLPPCADWILGDESWDESDLRSTQIAMLTADVCAYQVISEWGIRPDIVTGHSFGEYAALVSSGTLEFESAIPITLARANAVFDCAHSRGAMLSIAATLKEVQPLIANRSDVFISHCNAPRQTVVAGTPQGVTELAETIKSVGIPAVQVPVGSPFHTPLLEGARAGLKAALQQHRWRPPRTPLLSSVSGRFVADRDDMISNLTEQLIQPVYWVRNVERLLSEEVCVFLEVGPGRVLTKLTQQIIGDRNAIAIPMDNPSISVRERQLRIAAAMEVVGILPQMSSAMTDDHAAPVFAAARRDLVRTPIAAKSETAVHSDEQPASHTSVVNGAVAIVAPAPEIQSDPAKVDALAEFLIDIIVEQTGYPRDVIELDWDMEADLGIDSIRKAQIFGELREYFEMSPESGITSLHQIRTIRDILNLLRQSTGKGDWLEYHAKSESTEPLDVDLNEPENEPESHLEPVYTIATVDSHANGALLTSTEGLDNFLIDFIVERTGYPRDVIELDADLEADLGIDSIAKAQLIGGVRDHFHLVIDESSTRAVLSDLRTLRQIHEIIEKVTVVAPGVAVPVTPNSNHVNGHSNHVDTPRIKIDSRTEQSGAPASQTAPSTHSDAPHIEDLEVVSAFNRGRTWGHQHKIALRNQLFDFADRAGLVSTIAVNGSETIDQRELSLVKDAELRGVAVGANVHPQNLFSIRNRLMLPFDGASQPSIFDEEAVEPQPTNKFIETPREEVEVEKQQFHTHRFRLEMSPVEERRWSGVKPELSGGAIVIGNHLECEELVRRLKSFGVVVSWIRELGTREEAVAALDEIWKKTPSPHLFIMSPRDSGATSTLDRSQWLHRRETGITSLFWFCQKWLGLVDEANLFDDASLIGLTALGGDFGISSKIDSAESGALAGLMKAIVIETWVNGHRTLPVKILDLPLNSSPAATVDAICVELAEHSYDVEIGWNGQSRTVLRAIPTPLAEQFSEPLIPRGNWVVTGGARGITAYVVKQMAIRFPEVHFHLLGTAPHPKLTEDQRRLAQSDPAKLRASAMHSAKQQHQSPLKAWEALEKEIEIDRTLVEFKAAGILATYHSCDVANRTQLSAILDTIRREAGPIAGVIHGAGIGKDASYHKKESSMVERCLSAKLDGALNLMSLTRDDSLQAFIAFGSISGRFGANGHTDYSMANDMLAKLVGWHRQLRPELPSTVFHWHAWDDIGMAIKPETRLALEVIGMKLMPAKEGVEHFIREIDAGLPLSEVLITDTHYYRMFYPADRMLAQPIFYEDHAKVKSKWPLVYLASSKAEDSIVCEAPLDPVSDPFLKEHRFRDRPLLPMVIMTELLAEAGSVAHNGERMKCLRDFEIITSVKFPTDSSLNVRINSRRLDTNTSATELRADFYSTKGKLVSADRLYAKAVVEFETPLSDETYNEKLNLEELKRFDWRLAQYPPVGSVFYVGGPLQCLRKFAVDAGNKCIWGRISAPSISELAGYDRDVSKWQIPCAVLDAALFTSGVLAWSIRPGVTLPQGATRIAVNRCPRPAEICWVRSKMVYSDQSRATFDITIWGSDKRPFLVVQNYVAAWLPE